MRFEDIDVHTLLPQQEPFVMIDQLLHFDEVTTTTRFTVREDHLYVENGRLNACALIENIAQTCAARMGYINVSSGKKVRVGVIGALRDVEIFTLPAMGSTIKTRIEVSDEVFGMTLAQAESRCENTLLCKGTIKIALL